ncbi:alkaline phosphatase family protein [Calderihabitans maritimus]|uniref:Type I phosphodiesterase/nucleotide pyrophosphatase n=1 Tax=Calderihabitans maritimus TaxID=1246530 RepID=A0A1Z5HX00_9FIRM|nr:alkaline phosphatase family protein [Calderihabitans maritimus]GAW94062.1 type I phosphodiesterase/nucleotide pyrophosphatase [Calderihabitans maritimus]
MFFKRNREARTFVLGIDGLPYSLVQEKFKKGEMPNLAAIAKEGQCKRINSVYPTISSVAWASYMTGKNPAEHGIFGFVDREPNPFRIKIPTGADRKAETLWHRLSKQGKRVIVINVPVTYPPEPVNGIITSGFLCMDIDKSSYPKEFNSYLKERGYIIDVDSWLAREDKKKFMQELHRAMDKRFEIAFELMEKEKWDFFQLHIMETDRLMHFFWDDIEQEGEFTPEINRFFAKLDNYVGELNDKLSENDRLLILSDHGFCGIKYEVQLNTWLEREGLLKFEPGEKKELANYHPDSLCYSLLPGRIYINLEGREEKGTVKEADYEKVRQQIKERLFTLKDPETGQPVIDKVFFREEIYQGPYLDNAADIIAHPVNGYDLKGRTGMDQIFERSPLNGMHTCADALIVGKNIDLTKTESIIDIFDVLVSNSES